MAMVHFHFKHHVTSTAVRSGARAVQYLERAGEYSPDAQAVVGYNERTSEHTKDYGDLRYREVANLPSWAEGSAERFFESAACHEGVNRRWGTSIQTDFPRDLSFTAQQELARAFTQGTYPDRPSLWVIHEPISKADGLPQPHMHLLVNERIVNDGVPERPEAQMFKLYQAKYPERGGCRKTTIDEGDRQVIARLREAWCASANVALEVAGSHDLMDPRSFVTRGITRSQVSKQRNLEGALEITPENDERTPEIKAAEMQQTAAWWAAYKRSMGIDLRLQSPETATRLILREVRAPGSRAVELAALRMCIAVSAHTVTQNQPFIGNVRSKIVHAPGDQNYDKMHPSNRVRFASLKDAIEAGYRPAKNQHYAYAGKWIERESTDEKLERPKQHIRKGILTRQIHALANRLGSSDDDNPHGRRAKVWLRDREEGYDW